MHVIVLYVCVLPEPAVPAVVLYVRDSRLRENTHYDIEIIEVFTYATNI